MKWMKAVVREVVGLFVDDVRFAAAILVWVALVAGLFPKGLPRRPGVGCLSGGLAIILIVSAMRFARKAGRRR